MTQSVCLQTGMHQRCSAFEVSAAGLQAVVFAPAPVSVSPLQILIAVRRGSRECSLVYGGRLCACRRRCRGGVRDRKSGQEARRSTGGAAPWGCYSTCIGRESRRLGVRTITMSIAHEHVYCIDDAKVAHTGSPPN